MEEELISFKTAKLAKEKGFLLHTIDTFYQFDGSISLCHSNSYRDLEIQDRERPECYAPHQSLLQKWLREKHNIHINIHCKNSKNPRGTYTVVVEAKNETEYYKYGWINYEEALEKGLERALKLI